MRVSVAGTGYVGLVSGICLASLGHNVVCIDVDPAKVEKINSCEPPIYEEGLEELMQKHVGSDLTATTDLHQAVLESDLTLIAVGTPFDGTVIDLKYIRQVSAEIGRALAEKSTYHTVIVKSTVVPGTTEEVVLPILEEHSGKKAGIDFGVGMNPEFLKEGEAIKDFMFPDRIVLGGIDDRSISELDKLYSVFEEVDKLRTSPRTAEMIKYTANSLLATLISFSNEIGNLCAAAGGIDVKQVMQGVHLDKRLSPILDNGERVTPSVTTYIKAGCGFGGSCFPKDVKALVAYGQAKDAPMKILDEVVTLNASQPYKMVDMLLEEHPSIDGMKIGILGLAFKPGSDDMRESPSIPVVRKLLELGGDVIAYDPIAKHEAQKIFENDDIRYEDNLSDVVEQSDAILLITRWPEFAGITDLLKGRAQQPLIIDGRRMLDKHDYINYRGIGL